MELLDLKKLIFSEFYLKEIPLILTILYLLLKL